MIETCENSSKPKTFKEMMRSAWFWKTASGIIIGGILGFLYYYYEGCTSGTCAITGNPISSTLVGSALGYFLVNKPCKTC
jgi:hypothetical protein